MKKWLKHTWWRWVCSVRTIAIVDVSWFDLKRSCEHTGAGEEKDNSRFGKHFEERAVSSERTVSGWMADWCWGRLAHGPYISCIAMKDTTQDLYPTAAAGVSINLETTLGCIVTMRIGMSIRVLPSLVYGRSCQYASQYPTWQAMKDLFVFHVFMCTYCRIGIQYYMASPPCAISSACWHMELIGPPGLMRRLIFEPPEAPAWNIVWPGRDLI